MTLKNVLIVDTETNGLDPSVHDVIEVGAVLWSVEHSCMVEVYSGLRGAKHNDAAHVNGIKPVLLAHAHDEALDTVRAMANDVDAYVAHNAEFDAAFLAPFGFRDKPWICTIEDFLWPVKSSSMSLVSVALAHGVGVVAAHRAVNDCLIIARLFERLGDAAPRLISEGYRRAIRPKATVIAKVDYKHRNKAKDVGFRWDDQGKRWWRRMAIEDAKELPFPTEISSY